MIPSIKGSNLLLGLLALLLVTAMALVFFFAPEEKTQGVVQKILYLHLAAVAAMYICLFLGLLFAAIFLASKQAWSDALSVASVEVGYLFTTAVLLTGSIWAKPVWGTWWTWDARLTTTLLIWLIFSAYMLLRYHFGHLHSGKVWCAILAILGFLDVPLIHYSVRLFRGIHPRVITAGGIATPMLWTLLVTIVALLALAACLVYLRYAVEMLRQRLQQFMLMQEE